MPFLLRILGLVLLLVIFRPAWVRSAGPAPTVDYKKEDSPLNPSQGYLEPVGKPDKKKKVAFRIRSDFYSRYMWHGIAYSNGAVWQPSATVEGAGFGFNIWGNFVLNDEPDQGEFNEMDLTLYYQRTVRKLNIQFSLIGAIYMHNETTSLNKGPNTLSGILQLSYPVGPVFFFTSVNIGLVNPGGTVFWDMGVNYQRNLPLRFSLETSGLFGIGDARFNREFIADVGTKANLFEYSLAFPWRPLRGLRFGPSMTISVNLSPSLRRAMAEPTVVWGGLSMSYDL